MSNLLWKKLHLCFSSSEGLHRSSPSDIPSSNPSTKTDHSRLFHRRHQRTTSIFINNFNFLYDNLSSPHHRRDPPAAFAPTTATRGGEAAEGEFDGPAGFATVFSSKQRRKGGEENRGETGEAAAVSVSKLLSGGVAVMKHVESPDPYRDFRRSMREMVEARNDEVKRDVAADREYLHELLFCYLSLNPKHTHKFIISAFSDTLVSLLSPSSPKSN